MKLLLTGAFNYSDQQLEKLKEYEFEITYIQNETQALKQDVSQIEAVICNSLFLYTPIQSFPRLKFLQLTSAGTDRVAIDYIKQKGIKLHTAGGVYSAPMAEWVISKLLEIYKKSHQFKHLQANRQWQKIRDVREMTDKIALILGMGNVGTEVAKRLKAFGVEIWGVDQVFHNNSEELFSCSYKPDRVFDLLPDCDILVICLPLTDDTRHFIGIDELNAMKDNAVLINVSRGAVIDQNALIDILNRGKFSGVALDVFEEEPLPASSPLWDMNNVIVTPHISYISDNINTRLFDLMLNNLRSFIN